MPLAVGRCAPIMGSMDEAREWVLLMEWEIVKGAEPPLEALAG